jgi:hypothetical protein
MEEEKGEKVSGIEEGEETSHGGREGRRNFRGERRG